MYFNTSTLVHIFLLFQISKQNLLFVQITKYSYLLSDLMSNKNAVEQRKDEIIEFCNKI